MAAREPVERLPRCCDTHGSWSVLTTHLSRDFPSIESRDVVRQVDAARQVIEFAAGDLSDALLIGELIARNQLMLLSGERRDMACLDPQQHVRRRATHPAAAFTQM